VFIKFLAERIDARFDVVGHNNMNKINAKINILKEKTLHRKK
jgi:hypothetical protein